MTANSPGNDFGPNDSGAQALSSGDQLLTLEEFSHLSRLSPSTIHRLKNAGKLPFVQPAGKGGKLLFARDFIDRLNVDRTAKAGATDSVNQLDKKRLSGARPKWERDLGKS